LNLRAQLIDAETLQFYGEVTASPVSPVVPAESEFVRGDRCIKGNKNRMVRALSTRSQKWSNSFGGPRIKFPFSEIWVVYGLRSTV
jgi:hypothetical protein